MTSPSPGQLRVLRAIAEHQARHGWMPTVRELLAALDLRSTNGIAEHLAYLEGKGLLERGQGSRAMRITRRGRMELVAAEREGA